MTKQVIVSTCRGIENLLVHIRNALKYNVQPIVAVNRFKTDSEEEIAFIIEQALAGGAAAAVESAHWYDIPADRVLGLIWFFTGLKVVRVQLH